jgi:hypothetical protein
MYTDRCWREEKTADSIQLAGKQGSYREEPQLGGNEGTRVFAI